jgi:uroporphyrinogen-III synthase
MSGALAGRRIAVPETRELDVLARMLERHGAVALRCPLVAIHDAPDTEVEAWLRRFVADPPDHVVLLTGEGIGRLLGFARRFGLEEAFVAVLSRARKAVRGPKPTARLRALGLKPDLVAPEPTTAGVTAALVAEDLSGRRVAVQLYPGADQGTGLLDALNRAGARADPVLPYVYAPEAEDRRAAELVEEMAAGRVDLIAFTSSPQVRRLVEVARAGGREHLLGEALRRVRIAAVGPIVARAVEEAGGRVSIAPAESFHMKPMVNAIVAAIGTAPAEAGPPP